MVSERVPPLDAPHMTADEFYMWAANRELPGQSVELIAGERIAVPTNGLSSYIASLILAALVRFVTARSLGYVFAPDVGLQLGPDTVVSPDMSFVSRDKLASLSYRGFVPAPPDLAVEVILPTDRQADIRRKLALYAEIGMLVWVIDPERRLAEVYAPDAPVQIVPADGVLSAPELLPGFALALADVFSAIP